MSFLQQAKKAKETEEKAKEESIRREERDLFFKLLDLHLNQLKSITYKTKDKIYEGIEAVLAHEIGHVANGDMVTQTLLQGLLNTFVIFLASLLSK